MATEKKKGNTGKEKEEGIVSPRDTAFFDQSARKIFVIKSTVQTSETCVINDKELPLYKIETSSASHPVFTNQASGTLQTSRIKKFLAKYNN